MWMLKGVVYRKPQANKNQNRNITFFLSIHRWCSAGTQEQRVFHTKPQLRCNVIHNTCTGRHVSEGTSHTQVHQCLQCYCRGERIQTIPELIHVIIKHCFLQGSLVVSVNGVSVRVGVVLPSTGPRKGAGRLRVQEGGFVIQSHPATFHHVTASADIATRESKATIPRHLGELNRGKKVHSKFYGNCSIFGVHSPTAKSTDLLVLFIHNT